MSRVIAWFSHGAASAVAAKLAIEKGIIYLSPTPGNPLNFVIFAPHNYFQLSANIYCAGK